MGIVQRLYSSERVADVPEENQARQPSVPILPVDNDLRLERLGAKFFRPPKRTPSARARASSRASHRGALIGSVVILVLALTVVVGDPVKVVLM